VSRSQIALQKKNYLPSLTVPEEDPDVEGNNPCSSDIDGPDKSHEETEGECQHRVLILSNIWLNQLTSQLLEYKRPLYVLIYEAILILCPNE
jgi:hypothetical protein